MRENNKPIIALMLFAPVLTELLSGNVPLPAFLNPGLYLLMATISYGFPILLLREFGVRRGVGLLGMLPLGLCYGIVNEGFLAKTFFLPHQVPIPSFDQYGFVAGIEIPWALTITTWHALYAFLFPIVIVEAVFPDFRGKPWLSKRGAIGILLPTAVLTALIFFTHPGTSAVANMPHFIELWVAFVGLVALATFAPSVPALAEGGLFHLRKVAVGAVAFLAILAFPAVFAGLKLPLPIFGAYFALVGFFVVRAIASRKVVGHRSLLIVGLGAYLAQAVIGILTAISMHSPIQVATEVAFVGVFSWALIRLKNSEKEVPAQL